jgi:predicted porin
MNKKLVALAVAGAFALPMAAQAQTANVTLYGRLNLDYEFVKAGGSGDAATGSSTTVHRLSSNSSRFGLRGTESLGGGLSAIFQIESSVVGDASGGTIAGRETFVGLQGSWGTFKMGRFLAPYDDIHPIFGNVPTLTTSILSTAALWAQGTLGQPENGGFDDRVRNSVRYDSPTVAGFNGSIQYGTYEDTRHAGVWSVGGFYNNGPIQAGVAYEKHKDIRFNNRDDDALSIAGGYNFGLFRIAGVYERLKYEQPTGDLKRDLWGVSGTVNLGPGQLYLSWEKALEGKGSAADSERVGGLAHGNDTEADHFTISYTYPLSKRTLTYAGYTHINNKPRATYTFNINPYPVSQGGDPRGLVFGLVHFF